MVDSEQLYLKRLRLEVLEDEEAGKNGGKEFENQIGLEQVGFEVHGPHRHRRVVVHLVFLEKEQSWG